MAGFTSYAETVSVYGTERAFIDGDDTPWSKAFLAAAYASRGIKMRCTSGAGSELLMGFHESKSLLYLEARCLCLQRGMGVQGTQNGGIDGAPVTATVPGGVRELMAENLLAVWLDLECASGNDARSTESEIRVGAKIMPYLIAGSDLICSGFGSILKYDNSFNPSLLNGEELEDFLVLQRDFEADGGLTPIAEDRALDAPPPRRRGDRRRASRSSTSASPTAAMRASVVVASGSDDTESYIAARRRRHQRGDPRARHHRRRRDPGARTRAASARRRENLLSLVKLRVSGDYLQTSAIVRDGRVLSAVNDPNDYPGPGTGYRVSEPRAARDQRHPRRARPREVLRPGSGIRAQRRRRRIAYRDAWAGRARHGRRRGGDRHQPGLRHEALPDARRPSRSRRVLQRDDRRHREPAAARRASCACATPPTPRSSACRAARLSGSGIGIGIQAKGTAVIHQRRPAAAQQSRALLQRADHHAGALPPARRQRRRLRARRAAGAGRRADPRRGDGRALPRARRADLRDRDRR